MGTFKGLPICRPGTALFAEARDQCTADDTDEGTVILESVPQVERNLNKQHKLMWYHLVRFAPPRTAVCNSMKLACSRPSPRSRRASGAMPCRFVWRRVQREPLPSSAPSVTPLPSVLSGSHDCPLVWSACSRMWHFPVASIPYT